MTTQTTTLDDIIPLVEKLSLADQAELLTFIGSNFKRLIQVDAPQPRDHPLSRAERVNAVYGKYAAIRTSSDEFMRRKHEDTEREENQWRTSL